MNRRRFFVLAAVLATSAGGCAGVRFPNFSHPGTATEQQREAQRFDPYPENDTGPPIAGARPLEYQKQVPETSRARQFSPWGWSR